LGSLFALAGARVVRCPRLFAPVLLAVTSCFGVPEDAAQDAHALTNAPSPTSGSAPIPPPSCASRLFGSHCTHYPVGTIVPSGSPSSLDEATASFYREWKAKYLVQGCGAGRYYVQTAIEGSGGGQEGASITVSEGHGYGMIITAMMAGHDPEAQRILDGLYLF